MQFIQVRRQYGGPKYVHHPLSVDKKYASGCLPGCGPYQSSSVCQGQSRYRHWCRWRFRSRQYSKYSPCERSKLIKSFKAIARAWAQAGAAGLVLVGRTAKTLNLTADQISKIDGTIPFIVEPTDISDESSVKSLFDKVKAKFGKGDVLINNAASHASGSIGEIPLQSWWGDYVRILIYRCSRVHVERNSNGTSVHRKPTSKAPSSPPNPSSKPSGTKAPSSTSSA